MGGPSRVPSRNRRAIVSTSGSSGICWRQPVRGWIGRRGAYGPTGPVYGLPCAFYKFNTACEWTIQNCIPSLPIPF
jgi:hypothetical protein